MLGLSYANLKYGYESQEIAYVACKILPVIACFKNLQLLKSRTMVAQNKNQRECFRLTYPYGARPRFENSAAKKSIDVTELSEGGFRTQESFPSVQCNDVISGTLHFSDHSKSVDATVKRISPECTVYMLAEPLTTIELLREQATVSRKFLE